VLEQVPVELQLEPVSPLVQQPDLYSVWRRHLPPIHYLTGCQATQGLKL
jgi:hypothetical protein